MPRFVVAAPASGAGKTTVAMGLMGALAAGGLTVSPHKVGPDYIDPGYHALAAGRVGRNLDAFLAGEQRIAPLFTHGASGADIAVVEGVMGLFDGAAGMADGFASSAHVARLLAAPVLLVVDVSGQGASVAAVVRGFADHDPRVHLGGVILNRVGSDRHEQILREALAPSGIPVLGVLRRNVAFATPARHLGLIPAAERAAVASDTVAKVSHAVTEGCDLEGILRLARSAPPVAGSPWDPTEEVPCGPPVRVALAQGVAFTFCYAEHAELLKAAGAEVVPFDPLRDEQLPAECAGLVIGGGFPEVHAEALSANRPLRSAVVEHIRAGRPVAAECAGLLYLLDSLDGQPMCGVLPGSARMTPTLTLGYRTAVSASDSVLASRGLPVHGHEFHRTTVVPSGGVASAWRFDGRIEGFVHGSVHASYLHLHWAGHPQVAARFVAAARAVTGDGAAA